MANHQSKLSDLFTELEQDITALEKRKVALEAEIVTKEAKVAYLDGSIVTKTKQHEVDKQKQHTVITDLEDKIDRLIHDRTEVEKSVITANQKLAAAESNIETMQQSTDNEVKRLNDIIGAKKATLSELTQDVSMAKEALEKIRKTVEETKRTLVVLDDLVATKRTEIDQKIVEIEAETTEVERQHTEAGKKLDVRQEAIEDLDAAITTGQAELKAVTAKHKEFLDYEERAKKALLARENALLEGEQSLSQRSRRTSLLDNV